MARLVERILVWLAILITAAAVLAIAINFLPSLSLPARFDKPLAWLRAHQPAGLNKPPIERAEDLIAAGDPNAALKAAQLAIAEDPNDAVIDNRAGNVALRAGDTVAAERYYLAGENADHRYAWNFVALGQLYERRGDRDRADAQLRAAASADPNMAFVHYDLAVVELDERLFAAALADFEAELKHSPDFKPALIGRAEALDKLGRGKEAIALYRRAGVATRNGKRPVNPPSLKSLALVQPSPSPTATAVTAVTASPTPTATVTPLRVAAQKHRVKRPARGGTLALADTTPEPTATAGRPPWANTPAGSGATTTTQNPPATAPRPLTSVIAEARNYVLGVSQDLNFTRALPAADPNQSTSVLRAKLNNQLSSHNVDIEGALRTGTAALLSGRLELAADAYRGVADDAPRDWRGPYFAGLTSQAQGDNARARTWFIESVSREARPEPYTSLAILDMNEADMAAANVNARKAAAIDPTYEPGRFVAGMIDLVQTNVRGAERNLEAAMALGGAPSRTEYFINALQQSVGEAALPSLR
ncbi:MAG: tetratricopeptide repeat protein [Candidatus Eremiobacteraeota bacterium]|nr:tetratricopeptide repeat protein [Candidatus Eremiobacteraeota bacterium]